MRRRYFFMDFQNTNFTRQEQKKPWNAKIASGKVCGEAIDWMAIKEKYIPKKFCGGCRLTKQKSECRYGQMNSREVFQKTYFDQDSEKSSHKCRECQEGNRRGAKCQVEGCKRFNPLLK